MLTIVRSTLKLLFRNPGFWFFLLFAPAISMVIFGLKMEYSVNQTVDHYEIYELEEGEKTAYQSTSHLAIKVFDACGSEKSEYLLNDLASIGMYKICRLKCDGMTFEEYKDQVADDAYNDRMGAALYIPEDFDELLAEGDTKEAIKLSVLCDDDERMDLFLDDLKLDLSQMMSVGLDDLKSLKKDDIEAKYEMVAPAGERLLTETQNNNKMQLGYAFAMLTMGFVFCGIFVSHTAIEERKNMVLTRILLTGNKYGAYFVAKFIVTLIVSLMITGLTAGGLQFVDNANIGMSKGKLILLIMLMGIVFSSLSLLIGMMSGEIMSSNIIAFTLWAFSSLLSGMYFPLDDTTTVIRAISFIMPQKWFMNGAEMFYVQDKNVYLVLLCITGAYLLVILSVGSVGLKLKKQHE